MANKPKPPSAQSGKHFFDGKSLAEASPEELDKALDNILDVMEADNVEAANEIKPQLHLSKPADRSLQAFKDWMQTMGDKLMPGSPPDDATEEEWIADHKEFWEGVDEGRAKAIK
jgi:ABC-type nitrate/sulfonate/bicarbonate transport system substrate-binding protein